VRIPSLERKLSRLGKITPESTLVPVSFSPEQHYPRLSEVAISPGRKQSKEHTCSSKPFSPGRDGVAWTNYAENSNFYYLRANMHASYD